MRKTLLAVAALVPAFGQAPSTPRFDVASIKQNVSVGQGTITDVNRGNGVFTGTNVTARILIQSAYGVRGFQVEGGPGWVDADRFDVIAKPPEGITLKPGSRSEPGTIQLMLRSLLADRFMLVSHIEMREVPAYAL